MNETPGYNPWLHRYALLTAYSTFVLVIAGGLVTSTGSGLAVPDWPLSYGTLFPPMVGGILYEHGHRIVAATVGMMTVLLALWMWRSEPRAATRRLAYAAVLAVVVQGGLGGLTVIFLLPTAISVAHAGLAMAFFCITCALALITSRSWLAAAQAPPPRAAAAAMGTEPASTAASPPGERCPRLARLAAAATATIYAQILIGATVRHTGSGLACPDFPLCNGAIVPAIDTIGVGLHLLHRGGALAVALMVALVYRRVLRDHADVPRLLVPATIALTLVGVQFLLGALTVWNALAVEPTTAHVGGGALLLITMLTVTLRAHRRREPGAADVVVAARAMA